MRTQESPVYAQLVQLEKTQPKDADFPEKFVRSWENVMGEMSKIGGRFVEDGEGAIQRLARMHPGMIVRRESPKTLMNALSKGEDLEIRFDPAAHAGKAYPNAGVLGDDAFGLRIPYQRGFGMIDEAEGGKGKTVCIIGFVPGKDVHAKSIPRGAYPQYREGRERGLIRMVEGDVPQEDIRFVLFRIPASHVPDDFLTHREQELEQKFISRVFVLNEDEEKEKTEAA